MSERPVGVLGTIEDTIDRWNQFSGAIAGEKIKDWPSCIRLKDDMSVVETYLIQLEAELKQARKELLGMKWLVGFFALSATVIWFWRGGTP